MWFGSDKGPWRTLVRTEQAEPMLTAIDASMSCQVISCGSTRGAMVKRGAPIAWPLGFSKTRNSPAAPARSHRSDHR